jgi:aryl-alcohol dehydrogenase-like predicted oxidoreductase
MKAEHEHVGQAPRHKGQRTPSSCGRGHRARRHTRASRPAWLLAHDARVLLIPGRSSLDHLTENIATSNVRLDADTTAVLDGLA